MTLVTDRGASRTHVLSSSRVRRAMRGLGWRGCGTALLGLGPVIVVGCGETPERTFIDSDASTRATGARPGGGGAASNGGAPSNGGTASNGGAPAGGTGGAGGFIGSGSSSASGGFTGTGGDSGTGGSVATGGSTSGVGGASATGGSSATGGASATGGSSATGGASATGGSSATGGTSATGGSKATGGTSATGGAQSTGGAPVCTPNNTQASTTCYAGNEYWQNNCGTLAAKKKDCCSLGCTGGVCAPVNSQASKTCAGGNSVWVDSCGVQGAVAQNCGGAGCVSGTCLPACSSDMVPIGNERYCIDRYENSTSTSANCGTISYFKTLGDYPAGFPLLVNSSGLTGSVTVAGGPYTLVAQTTALYACSKANVLPAQYISYFQAKRACENSGKRICTLAEHQKACGASTYPYGNTYDATACNGSGANKGGIVATGSMTNCQGSVPGLFDMAGNVLEWAQCDASSCYRISGNFYSPASILACTNMSGSYASAEIDGEGFRCCKSR